MAGWTPLCYAVLRDDPFLVESLLEQKANPNEVTTKEKKDAQLPRGMPVLFIAGTYHSNKVRDPTNVGSTLTSSVRDVELHREVYDSMILWMAEIVHQLRLVLYPVKITGLTNTIAGGCLEFLSHQQQL